MGNHRECNPDEWPFIFHDYEVIREGEKGIREICRRCGKILITRKGHKGSIDNVRYLEEHRRDFLQPTNKLFEKEWGTPNWDGKHGNS